MLFTFTRDAKLIYSLLPDIPPENINIKTFAAFPETKIDQLLCRDCADFILSKEDFDGCLDHLKQKLCIKEPSLNEQNEELFLTACARLIGGRGE